MRAQIVHVASKMESRAKNPRCAKPCLLSSLKVHRWSTLGSASARWAHNYFPEHYSHNTNSGRVISASSLSLLSSPPPPHATNKAALISLIQSLPDGMGKLLECSKHPSRVRSVRFHGKRNLHPSTGGLETLKKLIHDTHTKGRHDVPSSPRESDGIVLHNAGRRAHGRYATREVPQRPISTQHTAPKKQ